VLFELCLTDTLTGFLPVVCRSRCQ